MVFAEALLYVTYSLEFGDDDLLPAFQAGFVPANACRRDVGGHPCVQQRFAFLDDGSDELLHKVRVRAAVTGALNKGNVFLVEDHLALRKRLQLVDQQVVRVRRVETARIFAALKEHRTLLGDLVPFIRHLCAIYVEALAVLADRLI